MPSLFNKRNSFLSFLLIFCVSFLNGTPFKTIRARNGMVVSGHILASQIGVQILKEGGNAIDAAIATGFALAVNLPSAGNIGGGGFMIVHRPNGENTTFDFREKAPLAAHPHMFLDKSGDYDGKSNHKGYQSVGVPGTVAGFFLAHKRFGSLPIHKLIEPSIQLAQKGFTITDNLEDEFQSEAPKLKNYPGSSNSFLKSNGQPYKAGETWKQPDLAQTLLRIQKRGRDGFYKGKTAQMIAQEMREEGGLITKTDLLNYEAIERTPVKGSYRGYQIISMGPPSSGGVALIEMLNIVEGFDLLKEGHGSAQHIHLLTESMRRAFFDRAKFLGDPDFNSDMPIEMLISKSYAQKLRKEIRYTKASISDLIPLNQAYESKETTHYSVVDSLGNAVVVTYTLEDSYGSRIAIKGLGFLLNNQMGDFNPVPGETTQTGQIGTTPNLIAPNKRMLSSMTPTIVLKNDNPFFLIGSPGGRTIINTVFQLIVNIIDFKMDIGEAIEAGRIHHQWFPDQLKVEPNGFSTESLSILRAMGHRIQYSGTSNSQGRAMGILIDPRTKEFMGCADPRSADGAAIGY